MANKRPKNKKVPTGPSIFPQSDGAKPQIGVQSCGEPKPNEAPSPPLTVGQSQLSVQQFLQAVENSLTVRQKPPKGQPLKVGLDLGTASIVLVVLDESDRPLAAARRFAQVIKDGLVVDFGAARSLVEELKGEIQEALGVQLSETAIAVPPGTSTRDTGTHQYVARGAGLEVNEVMDEPSAANLVLNIQNGAIVDIGGGTTGVAILEKGLVVHTFDEPTGGTHLSLVLAGHYHISFEEAETMKQKPENALKVAAQVAPVLQKIGTIVKNGLGNYAVHELHLVGGTAISLGIDKIISQEVGVPTFVSLNPILVTPAGIALGAVPFVPESF
ncbi:MAG: ethanolamine utilization protein EutJ [Candidatus Adiutrix sp.]